MYCKVAIMLQNEKNIVDVRSGGTRQCQTKLAMNCLMSQKYIAMPYAVPDTADNQAPSPLSHKQWTPVFCEYTLNYFLRCSWNKIGVIEM